LHAPFHCSKQHWLGSSHLCRCPVSGKEFHHRLRKNGYLGINSSAFAVIAIQALKELAIDNDQLEQRLDSLTSNCAIYHHNIEELEKQMNDIQSQLEIISKIKTQYCRA
jgi:cell division protein FtsB